jgi:hypothetical protein
VTYSERTARVARISTALALQNDRQLSRLVDEAAPWASGIGGTTLALEIEGCKVFAKRLRLTDLERRPENVMSTENVFELPTYCQRNVGSSLICLPASLRSSVDTHRSPRSSTTSTSSCTAKAEAHATRTKMPKPCCGQQQADSTCPSGLA